MKIKGTLEKRNRLWVVECETIQAGTQGQTRKEALSMIVDWIQGMLDDPDYEVEVIAPEHEGEQATHKKTTKSRQAG